ncbi:MAG: hemerythrin family protein [Comamonadaceae bacterium]|nr:hemerythrin family protein [Comamonadaceae bacterium]
MSVVWSDSCKLGDPEVDQQHQYLIELTNEFIAADSLREMRSLIMLLYKHTREHFEKEEELMRRVDFPELAHHQELHNRLLSRLSELSMDVGKGYMNKPAIVALMTDWATKHIVEDDLKVVAFMAPKA